MNYDVVYQLETKMWEAAKYRCTGKEYADIISVFDCKNYEIKNFEIVNEDTNSIQVHYVIICEVDEEKNQDLGGAFQITTTWRNIEGIWQVVFNMDQRVC